MSVILLMAVYERTTLKHSDRGMIKVCPHRGWAAQNLCLEVAALGLGAVTIGAFYDEWIATIFELPEDEQPLYPDFGGQ